ncbi:MAG TPA: phosphoribosyltransferase [Thermoguttaceae bacterium]|nr:phosphoribosyltransferase [Thermoguttaceae bacterium]
MEGDFFDSLLADSVLGQTDPLEGEMPSARVLRKKYRLRFAKMLKEETLAEAVTDPPKPGESIHAVSNGKYDFATWIPQIIDWIDQADCLYCSTWTLSRANADDIFSLHDDGKIASGQLHFLTGLYFKRRETATYNYLLDGLLKRGGRYKAFENHCKVLLIANAARNAWITVEGSANLNANPRFEQYAIVNDRALFEFHRGWMEEVFASQNLKNYRSTTTARERGFRGYSIRRAGLGVTVVSKHHRDRDHIIQAKLSAVWEEEYLNKLASRLAELIRVHFSSLPMDSLVSPPPQGASWPGPYFAGVLAEKVAALLGRPFALAFERTDEKKYHHPMESLRQAAFRFIYRGPVRLLLVIDDIITSGATMRRALEAAQLALVPVYGFAYYGA